MARITINTLVNQVKKVIAGKAGNEYIEKAYINGNGDIIASNYGGTVSEVKVFITGVFADAAASDLNKLYSKDALTVYAKTGVLAGGVELPEAYKEYFSIPEDNFVTLCTVAPEVLKNVLNAVSRDDNRPFITGFNINSKDSLIESCDGFRCYRAPIELVNTMDHDVIIYGAAANNTFKGNVEIAAGEKYARLTDTATGLNVYTRLINGSFVNLNAIFLNNARYRTITVNNMESITPFIKAACKLEKDSKMVYLRVNNGRLDYSIPGLDIVGSLDTDNSENITAAAAYNPVYLLDAITAAGNTITFEHESMSRAPLTIGNTGAARALILPIRTDYCDVTTAFEKLDSRTPAPAAPVVTDNTTAAPEETPEETRQAAPADLPNNEETPAPEVNQETTTAPADSTPEETTTPEVAAVAAINEKQNKDNHFVNISPEDVKRQQAITAAQAYYKALHGYKPNKIQVITAEAIYAANKAVLQPIARRAGGLYIDNIAIIAAITAAADLYELQEV